LTLLIPKFYVHKELFLSGVSARVVAKSYDVLKLEKNRGVVNRYSRMCGLKRTSAMKLGNGMFKP